MEDRYSSIENMQNKLYSPKESIVPRERRDLKEESHNYKSDWNNQNNSNPFSDLTKKPNKKIPFLTITLILAFIFFIGAIGYAAYNFWGVFGGLKTKNVEINVSGPVATEAGQILSLDIRVQNNNENPIEVIDFVVEYPNGTKSSEDLKTDLKNIRKSLGTIGSGDYLNQEVEAVLFGEEGETKEINIYLEYKEESSSAVYKKSKKYEVLIQNTPIRFRVEGVKETIPGQEVSFDIFVESNSTETINDVIVEADYPFGFKYTSANINPLKDNSVWVFEELRPGEQKKITVKGIQEGQNNEERVFRFKTGIEDDEEPLSVGIAFSEILHSILISRPFLDLVLSFNGLNDSVISLNSDQNVSSVVSFLNTTDDTIRDVELIVKLDGQILNEQSIQVNKGFYRSIDNSIVWNNNTSDDLKEILPGESTSYSFGFNPYSLSSGGSSYINPNITFDVEIKGRRINENNVPEEIVSKIFREIRFNTKVSVDNRVSYDQGPFVNTGPLPPIAEQPTSYTVTWKISNTSNNLSNAELKARLPEYVTWNNKLSPASENVLYDSSTKTFVWKIGNIGAQTGYVNSPKELSFQVTILPSVSQIGTVPVLINPAVFTATDTYTNERVRIDLEATSIQIGGGFISNQDNSVRGNVQ